jgi:hypothetical protein
MVRVRLKDIIEGMEFQSDEMTSYFHRPTGRVLTVSDEAFSAAEEDDEEWVEPEELAEARNILAHDEEYVVLPDRFEIDEYRMMQRFALGSRYVEHQDELLRSLHGTGAFRRFKDAVHRLGLADEWYSFRDHGYEEVAREWCAAHNIEIDRHGDA